MKRAVCVSAAIAGMLSMIAGTASADVIYVDPDAPGLPTGNSWDNAYRLLGVALSAAGDGDEVWVARGRYVAPSTGWTLNAGASVYGGFTPGATDLEDRDPIGTPTILDADTNGDDGPEFVNRSDNAERVLTVDATGGSFTLDGFVVRACYGWAAIEVVAADNATIENCLFRENHRTEALTPPETVRVQAYGGGVRINEPVGAAVFRGCVFERNRVENTEIDPANGLGSLTGGAGLASLASTTIVDDCVFRENRAVAASSAAGVGAFVLSDSAEFRGCAFTGNAGDPGGSGGGLYVAGPDFLSGQSATLVDCEFMGNTVAGGSAFSTGGGARLSVLDALVIGCDFVGNSCAADVPTPLQIGGGGGLGIDRSERARIVNCRVLGNDAGPSLGGGISLLSAYPDDAFRVENCLVAGNTALRAAGLFQGFGPGGRGAISVVNSTIADNHGLIDDDSDLDGGGLVLAVSPGTPVAVHNAAIWGNSSGGVVDQDAQVAVNVDFPPMLSIRRNLIEGWDESLGGVGNAGDDPLFIEPDGNDGVPGTTDDNYRLGRFSPAIDAGGNGLLPPDDFDLDQDGITAEDLPIDLAGNARRVDDIDTDDTGTGSTPIVDIGAYEFQRRSCPADLDTNGILDLADIGLFVGGFPSQSPDTDLNGDGIWDLADVGIFVSVFTAGCP
jgi:hypothetical protein